MDGWIALCICFRIRHASVGGRDVLCDFDARMVVWGQAEKEMADTNTCCMCLSVGAASLYSFDGLMSGNIFSVWFMGESFCKWRKLCNFATLNKVDENVIESNSASECRPCRKMV